jgi:hypothetical protein
MFSRLGQSVRQVRESDGQGWRQGSPRCHPFIAVAGDGDRQVTSVRSPRTTRPIATRGLPWRISAPAGAPMCEKRRRLGHEPRSSPHRGSTDPWREPGPAWRAPRQLSPYGAAMGDGGLCADAVAAPRSRAASVPARSEAGGRARDRRQEQPRGAGDRRSGAASGPTASGPAASCAKASACDRRRGRCGRLRGGRGDRCPSQDHPAGPQGRVRASAKARADGRRGGEGAGRQGGQGQRFRRGRSARTVAIQLAVRAT